MTRYSVFSDGMLTIYGKCCSTPEEYSIKSTRRTRSMQKPQYCKWTQAAIASDVIHASSIIVTLNCAITSLSSWMLVFDRYEKNLEMYKSKIQESIKHCRQQLYSAPAHDDAHAIRYTYTSAWWRPRNWVHVQTRKLTCGVYNTMTTRVDAVISDSASGIRTCMKRLKIECSTQR